MPETEQSYTHRKYFPWHHFVVVPILIVNLVVEIVRFSRAPAHGGPGSLRSRSRSWSSRSRRE